MTDDPQVASTQQAEEGIPWQQAMLDDVFMLLMAGLVVPTLFYIVWGLMELAHVAVFAAP